MYSLPKPNKISWKKKHDILFHFYFGQQRRESVFFSLTGIRLQSLCIVGRLLWQPGFVVFYSCLLVIVFTACFAAWFFPCCLELFKYYLNTVRQTKGTMLGHISFPICHLYLVSLLEEKKKHRNQCAMRNQRLLYSTATVHLVALKLSVYTFPQKQCHVDDFMLVIMIRCLGFVGVCGSFNTFKLKHGLMYQKLVNQ